MLHPMHPKLLFHIICWGYGALVDNADWGKVSGDSRLLSASRFPVDDAAYNLTFRAVVCDWCAFGHSKLCAEHPIERTRDLNAQATGNVASFRSVKAIFGN